MYEIKQPRFLIGSKRNTKEILSESPPQETRRATSGNGKTVACRDAPRLRRRLGLDDEIWKKNKRCINNYLRRYSDLFGKDLSLNQHGLAYFAYKRFIVAVEVPAESYDRLYVYTMVCRIGTYDNFGEVLKTAMEMNYMANVTRGSTLGLEGNEINLCHSCLTASLSAAELRRILEDFLSTAGEVNARLDAAKTFQDPDLERSYASA